MKTILNFKFAAIVLLFVFTNSFSVQAQEIIITIEQLPVNAQNFIKKHFPKQVPDYILEDRETFSLEYKVHLPDGTEIEFDRNGNWKEVDGNRNILPTGIAPATIETYIQTRFKGARIVKIDRGAWDYEVDLNNGLELKFNSKGQFLSVDD